VIRRFIYETLHPEIYHGYGKKPPFFEGWYYKLINADQSARLAVIPGIFRTMDSRNDHAFIQVLDGMTGHATYHEYPVSAFHADEERFDVRVGRSRFRIDGIILDIDDDQMRLCGELRFHEGESWPVSLLRPGNMGPFAWLPFLECYHGILSFDHRIQGALEINGRRADFDDGHGYLEKDWGQAFPSAYVWMQTNHFHTPTTSLTGSIAMVPSIGRIFRGFSVGFYHHRRLHAFATYTHAVTEKLAITDDHVFWNVRDRRHRVELIAERAAGGLLKAPLRTEMHKRVDETLQASVHVRLMTLNGDVIYEGTGRSAGLEVHGDLETLLNAK
jgi:hypothetical protein